MPSSDPSHLTAGAIKRLSDASTVKHHYKLDYVLQITRIKDLSSSKPSKEQETRKNGTADEKKAKSQMKFK